MSSRTASSVQFRIRGLLAVVCVVALFLSIGMPSVRTLTPPRQTCVFVMWFAGAVGCTVTVPLCAWGRYRSERRGGELLFVLPRTRTLIHLAASAFVIMAAVSFLLWLPFTPRLPGVEVFDVSISKAVMAGVLGAVAGAAFTLLWFRTHNLQFRQRGIVSSLMLVPWNKVTEYRWHTRRKELLILAAAEPIKVRVPETQRQGVEALLRQVDVPPASR